MYILLRYLEAFLLQTITCTMTTIQSESPVKTIWRILQVMNNALHFKNDKVISIIIQTVQYNVILIAVEIKTGTIINMICKT